ncbi:MAG TPA: aminoacyl-tRNA hydrolase [Candidatus Poseidoniales archaeon]|nr:aminoacyl-tRNA hydrolase [Candidatus Poseidoniales archaeon]
MKGWWRRASSGSDHSIPSGPLKLVCVIDVGLGMGKGKIASQVGHACMEVALQIQRENPSLLSAWRSRGAGKIIVRSEDGSSLLQISDRARKAGIRTHGVRDAGHTQVEPGSTTVLAIGPASESDLEQITGHLRLL